MFSVEKHRYVSYVSQSVYCIGYTNGFESVDDMMKTDNKQKSPNIQINTKEDTALIIYSSRTTGLPKGVVLSHYELVAGSTILR